MDFLWHSSSHRLTTYIEGTVRSMFGSLFQQKAHEFLEWMMAETVSMEVEVQPSDTGPSSIYTAAGQPSGDTNEDTPTPQT
jgi:hypothetical protein